MLQRVLLYFFTVVCGATVSYAEDFVGVEPRLVQDFNPCQVGLNHGFHIRAGTSFFFTTPLTDLDALFGVLQPSGVKNIRVSGVSRPDVNIRFVGAVGDIAYFTLSSDRLEAPFSNQLWRSDGTESGTTLVKDISPGSRSLSLFQIHPFGADSFIFTASSAEFGAEVWVSNGTPQGTRVLDSVRPGPESSDPRILSLNGLILAQQGTAGDPELYQLTPQLTLERVPSVLPASAKGEVRVLTSVGAATVFFLITTKENGAELWVTDGIAAGTRFVKDFVPGTSSPKQVVGSVVRDGRAYFLVKDEVDFEAIWESDGTSAGTRLIFPFNPDLEFKNVIFLTPTGKGVVFQADTKDFGRELWFSDGTLAGTGPITDRPLFFKGANISGVVPVPNSSGLTLVGLESPLTGTELFVTDGTREGTRLLRDHIPGPESGSPEFYRDISTDKVFYLASVPGGQALFETDGTVEGTRQVQRTVLGVTDSGSVAQVLPLDASRVVFTTTTRCDNTSELFSLNMTTLKADPVRASTPVGERSTGMALLGRNSRGVFFASTTVTKGSELWFTDGTSAGTTILADINPGVNSSAPAGNPGYGMFGERLFFFADDGVRGKEPFVSDGTPAGTLPLADLFPGPTGSEGPERPASTGTKMVFAAPSRSGSRQLWATDGTPGNLTSLFERSQVSGGQGFFLTAWRDRVLFLGKNFPESNEIWITDGSREGTSLFLDVKPFVVDGNRPMQAVGEKVLLSVRNSEFSQLILSDGSVNGTVVASIPGRSMELNPRSVTVISVKSGTALISADIAPFGQELWSLDISTGVLTLIRDISPGPTSSRPSNPLTSTLRTFFTATTPATGAETWVTDGTELGTKEVYDFRVGPRGSVARPLFANDDVLLVNHYSPIAGSELHYLSRSDRCPNDPAKTAPGACGCGTPDTDKDGDGTLDCVDRCPQDPSKVAPGFCGCGIPDQSTGRESPLACQTADFCPSDPAKREPGVCGCGIADLDENRDSIIDCLSQDLCPADPAKEQPGLCGCGVSEGRTNGDRQPACIVNVVLRVKLDQVIAQVRALRLPRDGRLTGGALRKVRAQIRTATTSVQGVLRELRAASRTIPALAGKAAKRSHGEAQRSVRQLRKSLARKDRAVLLRALRRLRTLL